MNKFEGNWTQQRVDDLIMAHQGRTHAETASHLSLKWNLHISRDSVKNKYNTVVPPKSNLEKLKEASITRDSLNRVFSDEKVTKKRTYFVTTLIAGCGIDENFFKSVQNFCSKRNAKLVILPMRGVVSKTEEFSKEILKKLGDHIYTDYTFNDNLEAFDIGVSPMQVNPLIGLARFAQKRTSLIVASPKQNMDTVPVSNSGIPHLLHSTGTLNRPSYPQTRAGMVSAEDHIIGGLIVEIQDKKIFHLRQVQAGEDGSFYDLDKQYGPSYIKAATAEAFVWGDIHCGNEDPTAVKAWREVMYLTKPKHIFLHDTFDGRSISHHDSHNISSRANRPAMFQFLETELNNVTDTLKKLTKEFSKTTFHIVRSNHDEHLDRYLDEARYIFDPHNYKLSLQLAMYRCDGLNPLQGYVESVAGKISNINWFKRDQDFKIAGVQLAAHGDKGANGARGNLTGTEKAYYKSVTGHSHSPRILRNAWQVGTTTKLRLSYTQGPSSWLHASALVYKNGQRQLIISIEGDYKI